MVTDLAIMKTLGRRPNNPVFVRVKEARAAINELSIQLHHLIKNIPQ